METITDENTTYILETTDEAFDSGSSEDKQIIYINAPITPMVINSNSQQVFIPSVIQNGDSLLKKNNVKRLSNPDNKNSSNLSEKQTILNHIQKYPRKKLSYERDFKPSASANKEPHSYNVFNRNGKRKLIVDQHTVIGGRQFKRQITNTHDIISSQDLAPSSKKEMNRLLNGITKMFAYPAHKIPSSELLQLYVAHCTSSEQPNAETVTDMHLSPIDNVALNKTDKKEPEKMKKPFVTYERRVVAKKENTETIVLVDATDSVNDHKYSKELKIEDINDESITIKDEEIILCKDEEIILCKDEEIMLCKDEEISLCKDEEITYTHEEITLCNDELIITDTNQETNEVITFKTDELDTGDERKIVILHKLGENISFSQKKLEALLAAANADQVIICNTSDLDDSNGYVIVQNDENTEIVEESEFILSN